MAARTPYVLIMPWAFLSSHVLPRAVLAFAVGGGGAAGTALLLQHGSPLEPTPVAASVPAAHISIPPSVPSFDVVRVGPTGSAVIAGRAEPGAEVTVRDNGVALGQTHADARGEWVLVPSAPLPVGGRELTLEARSGGREAQGKDTVILSVPERPAPSAVASLPAKSGTVGPLALLLPGAGSPRVLQGPDVAPRPVLNGVPNGTPNSTPNGAAGNTRLSLGTVDYNDRGEIRFAGSAPPNAPVRVYVDNKPAGDAVADAAGQWTLSPGEAIAGGVHRLRVDQLTPAGRVASRVELPFQRSILPAADLASGRVVVQPGESLWRLARSAYGAGVRYTVIYLANRDQIRDPKLIYPGQAFAVPAP